MKDEKDERTRCANEDCQKTAEEGSLFCASCGLEWALFHREARGQKRDIRGDRMPR